MQNAAKARGRIKRTPSVFAAWRSLVSMHIGVKATFFHQLGNGHVRERAAAFGAGKHIAFVIGQAFGLPQNGHRRGGQGHAVTKVPAGARSRSPSRSPSSPPPRQRRPCTGPLRNRSRPPTACAPRSPIVREPLQKLHLRPRHDSIIRELWNTLRQPRLSPPLATPDGLPSSGF